MRSLIKLILMLSLFFATTFIVAKVTGFMTLAQLEDWLEYAKNMNALYLMALVALLLFADLFIAVPTLSIMMLSGYFLGHTGGALASITGVMLAGVSGYTLSYFYGEKIERIIIKDAQQRHEMRLQFDRYGVFMILLSRAMPILPEVSACISGVTRMPFLKFIAAWSASSVPYVLIATYAGSISSIDNLKPAIITAITLSLLFMLAWMIFKKHYKVVTE